MDSRPKMLESGKLDITFGPTMISKSKKRDIKEEKVQGKKKCVFVE